MYMKARIIDIEDNEVTIKTQNGKFVTVPRKKLKFYCEINQTVVLEKNGDKVYIVPEVPSFWGDDEFGDDSKSKKESKKHTKSNTFTKILVVVAAICVLAFAPVAIFMDKDAKEKERVANLDNCLSEANSQFLKDTYSKKVECYEKYGGKDTEEHITENKRLLERANIDECYVAANEDYKVTDKEIKSAGTDVAANLILVKRVGNRLSAQKECYTKYGKIGDYSSELSKIEADIKENQSMIEYAENAQKTQNSNAIGKNWINCTTNTVGSSSYTNCY